MIAYNVQYSGNEIIPSIYSPNIIMFGGGSAQKDITSALIRKGAKVTRIVSVVDDGGSSGLLKDMFNAIPIGDIRNALLSMAQVSDCPKNLIRLLNQRLPKDISDYAVLEELSKIISMDHPLVKGIRPDSQKEISRFLELFMKELDQSNRHKTKFNLANASIGNLVLMGAYFQYSRDLTSAIYAFKKLCNIRDSVWPTSLDGNIHLGVIFENGSIMIGEHNITSLDRNFDTRRIKKIFLTNNKHITETGYNSIMPMAYQEAIKAINNSEIIIYGPGSFFTSVLPHFLIEGIAESISNRSVPKILISNILQDNETYGYELSELLNIFFDTIKNNYCLKIEKRQFITHIVANSSITIFDSNLRDRDYLPLGNLAFLIEEFISTHIKDYEDPNRKGYHDPNNTAEEIFRISEKEKASSG